MSAALANSANNPIIPFRTTSNFSSGHLLRFCFNLSIILFIYFILSIILYVVQTWNMEGSHAEMWDKSGRVCIYGRGDKQFLLIFWRTSTNQAT